MRQTLEQWLDYIGGLHPITWDLTLDRVSEVAEERPDLPHYEGRRISCVERSPTSLGVGAGA